MRAATMVFSSNPGVDFVPSFHCDCTRPDKWEFTTLLRVPIVWLILRSTDVFAGPRVFMLTRFRRCSTNMVQRRHATFLCSLSKYPASILADHSSHRKFARLSHHRLGFTHILLVIFARTTFARIAIHFTCGSLYDIKQPFAYCSYGGQATQPRPSHYSTSPPEQTFNTA